LLAHHFQQAVWLAEAAGRPCDILGRKAREALTEAGRKATGLTARGTAVRSFQAALAVCPPGHEDRAGLLTLLGSSLAWDGGGTEELTEAVELHVAKQDFTSAAEASRAIWRACYHRGDHQEAQRALDRTLAFLAQAEPGEQAYGVMAYAAHSLTLTGRAEEAIATARAALAGATGSERAVALETLGLARIKKGEAAGIDDIREAVAERRKAGLSPSLGLFNLGSAYATLGDARARKAVRAESRVAALRHGDNYTLSWLDSSRYVELFWEGRYDEALRNLDEAIGAAPSQPYLYSIRGRIKLLTGDLDDARADAAKALDSARAKAHPGELQHPLVLRARIALLDGAAVEVDELLTLLPGQQITGPIGVSLPIVLAAAGHGPDSLAEVSWSRWKDAAVAYLHGNREEAFRMYQEIGSVPDAAEAR
jgi:tetratricopeptide (TPR) repeat protein